MDVRRACVTGGSRGIGRAIATALTAAGLDVTIMGRSPESLDAAVAGGAARHGLTIDVTDPEALAAAIREGGFDVLVNNAGGVETGPFRKADGSALRRMLALNLESAAEAVRAALPGMTARGFGRIINVASTAGLKGYPFVSAYVAAKHGLVGLTRALAVELATTGITVNALCPGYTDTDLVRTSVEAVASRGKQSAEAVRAHFAASNPMNRLMRPEEVADAAVWLASQGAAAVTGQCIVIAGGEL